MAKHHVERSPAADEDLIGIWGYIARDSRTAADRVYDRIVERIFDLVDFPELGAKRPDIAADMRSLAVMSFVILYRVELDRVVVVRVVHGARDLTHLL